MIKADFDKDSIIIKGEKAKILTEFSTIVKGLYEIEGITKEEIEKNFKLGFLTVEEVRIETVKAIKNFLKDYLKEIGENNDI